MNSERLQEIGYTLKCCALCEHGRFYNRVTKAKPLGFCAKYGSQDKVLEVHHAGHCRHGFKPHVPSIEKAGLSTYQEFIK